MRGITETVKHLLIINVIMFIGTVAVGDGSLFYKWFALYFPKYELFQPWQIITHMFMHGNITHLLFNMLALYMFGTAVEQQLGNKRFLFIYFSAGLGALIFQLGFYYYQFFTAETSLIESGISLPEINEILKTNRSKRMFTALQTDAIHKLFKVMYSSMVGASGAIMGVLAAFGMMNPNAKLMLIFLPVPVKAKFFIPGIIILDIISAISGQSFFSPSNTAYLAHVGGALTGFLIMYYWKKNQLNNHRYN